jgi:acyl-CoA thioesterase II
MQTVEELLKLLDLEELDNNLFRGQNYMAPWNRVFGGQVLAQSLHAAYKTVPSDRILHSIHGYFILAGDINQPIIYDVESLRDGGSFATRRAIARQKGRPIFNMAASFQTQSEGLDHQVEMPSVPSPESLLTDVELLQPLKNKHEELYASIVHERPIEFRPVEQIDPLNPVKTEPIRHVWLKAKGQLPDDIRCHQEVLAYASDYNLLGTALLPHLDVVKRGTYFLASLDHAMWFHRDFRADEWLLYCLDSPSASNLRGFTRGNIFSQEGVLVASVVQEGLMSPIRK